MPEIASPPQGRSWVVLVTTARRAVRSGVLWGLFFGILLANESLTYDTNFPTEEARSEFARSFGRTGGLTAVTGAARRLDTVGGFVAWRMFFLMMVVGGAWGLLIATRLLRGEEDAGRWELFVAGRTTRRRATAQALVGLGAGLLALWAVTAAFIVAAGLSPDVGFSPTESAYYALAGTASAAVFMSIGALASQLTSTRRAANGVGVLVFGIAYVVRLVADSRDDLAGLRWASPLGWVENLAPLTDPQPWALVPILLLVATCVALTLTLADRRDVGVGTLARQRAVESRTRWLNHPIGLAIRLERWVALSWVAGLALLALVFGLVARTAGDGDLTDNTVGQTVDRLGGLGTGAAAWIGYEFLYLAAALAFTASAQIAAIRNEEADGYLDNLLTRPVSRPAWLAGRLALALAILLAAGLAAGVGGWLGAGGAPGTGLGQMLQAGLNIVAPAVFVLGLGALLYGLVPRLAAPVVNLVIVWSFLVQLIGSTLTTNRWLLDSAVLSHLRPAPAATPDWTALAWLVGLALVGMLGGLAAFNRRDLSGA